MPIMMMAPKKGVPMPNRTDGLMMPYNAFIPRLYNLCKAWGFEPGRIMPSRAFCSDENQGLPVLLITTHFGLFPFDHGRVGGVVATGRHGPHAHHGRDLVLIQASHVGYDPDTGHFGAYRRVQLENSALTDDCGKIGAVLSWYLAEYTAAREKVLFARRDGELAVIIDNAFLDAGRKEGLFLQLERLIAPAPDGTFEPLERFSTSTAFRLHPALTPDLEATVPPDSDRGPIGPRLTPDLFYFKRDIPSGIEGINPLEENLYRDMPFIVTAPHPFLVAAQTNTRIEFDRTYRTIVKEPAYRDRNLMFITGLNIDISPEAGQMFPLTQFIPWAAYIQTRDGRRELLEQQALSDALTAQKIENPDRIDLDSTLRIVEERPEVKVRL